MTKTLYALFKNGKQISKAHSTKCAAWIEAFERGAVYCMRGLLCAFDGYQVKEVKQEEDKK